MPVLKVIIPRFMLHAPAPYSRKYIKKTPRMIRGVSSWF